jgi:pilus assembly protein FimV
MFRKPVVAAGILLLAVSTRIHALGLGDIDVRSALNEPLEAVVELTSATDEQLEILKITIASREAFARAGISRPLILRDLEFAVERTPTGTPIIRITTDDPVREPFLDFLLEAAWPSGRLLRHYTVLIDPPMTMPASPPATVAPVTPTPPRAVAPPPPAPRPTPVTAPATAPLAAAPAPSTTRTSYGPVKRNETLWEVARRVRPDNDISMQQMMLALQRANPDAFIRNNINNLRRGVVLEVPTRDEILAIGATEASNEARRQHAEWRERRSQPAEQPGEAATDIAVAPAPAPEARLQLVAPEEALVEGTAVPGEAADTDTGAESAEAGAALAAADELRQELALANEEAEAGRQQTSELQSRVSELESQLADMQRLLELKDEQLASIQAGLTDPAGSEAQAQTPLDEVVDSTVAAETEEPLQGADSGDVAEQGPATTAEEAPASQPLGLVDRMMNNPILTGLGVIVAMVLGGIIWAGTRQRRSGDMFSDELTLESQMAAATREPAKRESVKISDKAMLSDTATDEADLAETDPVKEADIFLAYGRVQQAEDVILEGLDKDPTNHELKLKLLEVYHAGGNTESFNSHAQSFRNLVNEDDPQWQKIAVMGYEMSPDNPLYQTGSGAGASTSGVDFDMDLSGLDETRMESTAEDTLLGLDYAEGDREQAELPDSLEFNLDELGGNDEEDAGEGLLDSTDEVGTKLDLARAYIDMGDPDGARSILEEVLEEGNDSQKSEAEGLFAKLA